MNLIAIAMYATSSSVNPVACLASTIHVDSRLSSQ